MIDKFVVTALVGSTLLFQFTPVHALDCAKASSPVDKLICTTPKLKQADEEMGASYFKLLRETADPDFHEALIQSQRRWLKSRSAGPDRFGQAEGDRTDDRDVLLKMTRERLTFFRTGQPIQVLNEERKILAKDSGGPLAGFSASCVLQPPPYGGWSYECWGAVNRQNNDRVCSSEMEWASGHMSERRTVNILRSGQLKLLATCSEDDLSGNEQDCADRADDGKTISTPHWNLHPEKSASPPNTPGNSLWKYDPDISTDQIAQPWMQECLFAPAYPTPNAGTPRPLEK